MVVILLAIALFLGMAYLYLTDCGRKGILSNAPDLPKMEIPITYNVAWWAHQKDLVIEDFKVTVVENNLHLFNNQALISYTVKGKINYDGHWRPNIKEVHISERINKDSTQNVNRIIEITPIVEVKKDTNANDGIEDFEFTNQHIITSGKFGLNRIKIICENKDTIIEIQQRK